MQLDDWSQFRNCPTGPTASLAGDCDCADSDGDGNADLADFAAVQQAFGGQLYLANSRSEPPGPDSSH